MTAEVDSLTHRVAAASERLRRNTERLNAVIEAVDRRLQEINPGVEVWLWDPEDLLLSKVVRKPESEFADAGDSAEEAKRFRLRPECVQDGFVSHRVGYQLGFCRGDQGWGLAVRKAEEPVHQIAGKEVMQEESDKRTPLSATSRAIRLAAVKLLPTLMTAIAKKVEAFAVEVEVGLAPCEAWVALFEAEASDDAPQKWSDDDDLL